VVLGAGKEQVSVFVELNLGQRSFVAWSSEMGCAARIESENKNLVAISAAMDGIVSGCNVRRRQSATDHVCLSVLSAGIRMKKEDGVTWMA